MCSFQKTQGLGNYQVNRDDEIEICVKNESTWLWFDVSSAKKNDVCVNLGSHSQLASMHTDIILKICLCYSAHSFKLIIAFASLSINEWGESNASYNCKSEHGVWKDKGASKNFATK